MTSLKELLAQRKASSHDTPSSNGIDANPETPITINRSSDLFDTDTEEIESLFDTSIDRTFPPNTPQEHINIIQTIANLSTTEAGEPLKDAMDDLKKVLMENPSAVDLMLPEDIGAMVQALYRITGKAIAEAAKPKRKAKEPAKKARGSLTPEEEQALWDEL